MHTINNSEGDRNVDNVDIGFVLPENLHEYFSKQHKLCANVDEAVIETKCTNTCRN